MTGTRKGARKNIEVGETKRTRFLKVRCTRDEYEQVRQRAGQADMNLSDYLRHAAFNQRIVAQDAYAVLSELRRIGALIKHGYPAVQNWSPEEKRRYWETREKLLAYADQMTHRLGIERTDRKSP
jgi:hypothetical protein